MQLFVSYARPDWLRAESLAVQLRQAGIEVWLDSDLVGGQRWWDRILGQLRSCDAVVAALSKASIRSQACRSEREYAIQLGKPVLPITPSPVTGVSPHRGMAITTAILSFITILRALHLAGVDLRSTTTEHAGQAGSSTCHADSGGRALTCAAPVKWRPLIGVMRGLQLADHRLFVTVCHG